MSMLLRNLADYIANAGIATVGTDLFIEEMPPDPADALLLSSYASPPPDEYLNTITLDFTIWCRSQSTKSGGDRLERVFNLLHRNHHITLGDYYVYSILAITNTEDSDRDQEGRKLQKINFRTMYCDSRTVS